MKGFYQSFRVLDLFSTYFYLFMALLQRCHCKLGRMGKTHGHQAIEIKPRHVMTAWICLNKVSNYLQFSSWSNCRLKVKVWSSASNSRSISFDRFTKEQKWTGVIIFTKVLWKLQIKSCTVIQFLLYESYTIICFRIPISSYKEKVCENCSADASKVSETVIILVH